MHVTGLDHVNLRTKQLEAMIEWYTSVLGLRDGDRPNFPFPGAWLYAGDQAVVHLVGISEDPGAGSDVPLKLEHFALSASGRAGFEARLKEKGERFETSELQSVGIVQYNVWDPDGNHIHVDFSMDE